MARDPFRPNPWLTLGKLLGTLLITGVLAAGVLFPYVGGMGFVADRMGTKFLDTTCTLQETRPPQKTTLLARDGKTEIATLFTTYPMRHDMIETVSRPQGRNVGDILDEWRQTLSERAQKIGK